MVADESHRMICREAGGRENECAREGHGLA